VKIGKDLFVEPIKIGVGTTFDKTIQIASPNTGVRAVPTNSQLRISVTNLGSIVVSVKSFAASNVLYQADPNGVYVSSNTANLFNAMTVCGAGISLNIDANLQGSVASLYNKEKSSGRAIQEIVPKISALVLTDPQAQKDYADCLLKVVDKLK
jgi:hypothetical protein